jgi:hypothetical protein
MPERVLTQRELNRALLARQLLLERSRLPVARVLEQVAGLQTQYAPSGYVGLWTRLESFARNELTRALERRRAVQATLMRTTIHLVSAGDYPCSSTGRMLFRATRSRKTVFFTGSTDSGCGPASTDVGPFYCPLDKRVYIASVSSTSFARASVPRAGSSPNGAGSASVRIELQADCRAGVWANHTRIQSETGTGESRDVDARFVEAARSLVHRRLRGG